MAFFYLFQEKWCYMHKQGVKSGDEPVIVIPSHQVENQKEVLPPQPSRKSNSLGKYFAKKQCFKEVISSKVNTLCIFRFMYIIPCLHSCTCLNGYNVWFGNNLCLYILDKIDKTRKTNLFLVLWFELLRLYVRIIVTIRKTQLQHYWIWNLERETCIWERKFYLFLLICMNEEMNTYIQELNKLVICSNKQDTCSNKQDTWQLTLNDNKHQ